MALKVYCDECGKDFTDNWFIKKEKLSGRDIKVLEDRVYGVCSMGLEALERSGNQDLVNLPPLTCKVLEDLLRPYLYDVYCMDCTGDRLVKAIGEIDEKEKMK
ncbi:MAG: hypothetical protein LJE87_02285 [Deltaproteobacteria bacterium]|jgi:hypothetical protein|nr:hypothetical protein [Deltaproteobacteria bacterium]